MKLILTLLISISIYSAPVGKIAFKKGNVSVYIGKNKVKATKGMLLEKSSRITTGENGLAIIKLNDKSTMKISKNSSIKIMSILSKLTPTQIKLNRGSMFISVLKRNTTKKAKYKVFTRTAAMGVRGTTFFVSGTDKKNNFDTWMCVKEGLVDIKKNGTDKSFKVKAGEGIQVSKSKNTSAPKLLAWTKKLNWKFDGESDLENKVNIQDAYIDLLERDYE